ncbi:low-density lipoprotein receptor-related protein 11 [Ictalurus furcatus]|uniref:low-density lipoprotein receptor-related protein 11 n=1 Tax=Ictalurus furcatus TaxID=66913 RepID=UPI0023505D0B|nr:low-density lipoprotein receptor-related protein 11 [Ictalurus furcatus]
MLLFSALFHHQLGFLLLFLAIARASQISDLKSKLSGVEELLEEFRKQLQQDDSEQSAEDASDACVSDFDAAEERIIRAMASIERGATFLSAPGRVYSRRDCVRACCAEPRCTTAIVQEQPQQPDSGGGLRCYLFNCTYGGASVCAFSFQRGFSTFSRVARNVSASRERHRRPVEEDEDGDSSMRGLDEPPRSDAGMDVVIQLPTDWAILDGRDSMDDHGVIRYEWALVKGDPSISMKVTHPGLLKLSGLREGVYTFQMTVTDTIGQRSSDNVSVTVLAPEHHAEVCTHHCSPYQFMCDDGCCIDISYACDGKQHCPDRSDEDFCRNFDGGRKTVTHTSGATSQIGGAREAEGRAMIPSGPRNPETPVEPKQQKQPTVAQDPCTMPPVVGPCKGVFPRWYYDPTAGECKHFLYSGCKGNHNNFLQQADCANECIQKPAPGDRQATAAPPPTTHTNTAARSSSTESKSKNSASLSQNAQPVTKAHTELSGHSPPESGAILALVLGVIVSALLLLMVGCRLRVRRHRRKKALPLTTEESDYLINGMYL